MELLPIRRALLSVTDKTELVNFAHFLHEGGVELISTGGTAKTLMQAGLPVTDVSAITGTPEMLDGRVKTLHPRIHGAILADKDNKAHMATLQEHNILPIDLVCVNLYNFAEAAQQKRDISDAIEQIDIGGPCMLRAAAKNFSSVLVVPDITFYSAVRSNLHDNTMRSSLALRQKMAAATFALTAAYDAMIQQYFAEHG